MIETRYIYSRSLRSRFLSAVLRMKLKPKFTRDEFDHLRFRAWLEVHATKRKPEESVAVTQVSELFVKGEWNTPIGALVGSCILYLHGGGFIFGSSRTYRAFTTRLAKLTGMAVFSLDYRLAPEHPFPAALDDTVAAYEWLMKQGFSPTNILVAGDSAGGGLALSLLHAVCSLGYPTPSGCMVLSPFTDLLATGESVESNSPNCAMFNASSIRRGAAQYLGGKSGASPLASPLYGSFSEFPPTLIYVSDSEVLRDDSYRLAEKMDREGVDVRLNIWKGQPHVWPTFYPLLPEAEACLKEMADFAKHCQTGLLLKGRPVCSKKLERHG